MAIHMLSIDGGPQIGLAQSQTLINLEDMAFEMATEEFCIPEATPAFY
jgi:hypothetical protein